MYSALNGQPRLLFSIPYSGALPVYMIPGGKWMPLMKRTVREESGAWSLLKKLAVRARATATSFVSAGAPKLAADVAGAEGLR